MPQFINLDSAEQNELILRVSSQLKIAPIPLQLEETLFRI